MKKNKIADLFNKSKSQAEKSKEKLSSLMADNVIKAQEGIEQGMKSVKGFASNVSGDVQSRISIFPPFSREKYADVNTLLEIIVSEETVRLIDTVLNTIISSTEMTENTKMLLCEKKIKAVSVSPIKGTYLIQSELVEACEEKFLEIKNEFCEWEKTYLDSLSQIIREQEYVIEPYEENIILLQSDTQGLRKAIEDINKISGEISGMLNFNEV